MRAFAVAVGVWVGTVGIAEGATTASQHIQRLITQTEALPRRQRPAAYERILAGTPWGGPPRVTLTRAFAGHAFVLSLHYGQNRPSFREDAWERLLAAAWEIDPRDATIARALAKIRVNRDDARAALPVCSAFVRAHPRDHMAKAWIAWARDERRSSHRRFGRRRLLTFDVHFCVITRNPNAHRAATENQCRREVDILNRKFRTRDNKAIVRFRFKGVSSYRQVSTLLCNFVALGDSTQAYDSDRYARLFNACSHTAVRDPHAINFYIYDSHSASAGFADKCSHGKRNANRPYVLIDWQRLNNQEQNPEPHEMGHAFGLGHVGVIGAAVGTPTNIMTSNREEFGSGGNRELRFTPAQAAIIRYHAAITARQLR